MALPTLQRKLFKNDGYGPEIEDERLSTDITVKDWDASHDYPANVLAKAGGDIYRSVAASGPGTTAGVKDPAQDNGTYWKVLADEGTLSGYATQSWVTGKGYAVDSNVVHKTGDEYIKGKKHFVADSGFQYITLQRNDLSISSRPSTTQVSSFDIDDKNENPLVTFGCAQYNDGDVAAYIRAYYNSSGNYRGVHLHAVSNLFYPDDDNVMRLGTGAHRWTQLCAATTTIYTSDERLKSFISYIPDSILDVWGSIDFVQFKFNDAIADKGSDARIHSGLIAQQIDAAFKNAGLDISRYGLFCHDQWDAREEVRDEEGNVVERALEAGDRYALRYEEALCMEAAYQRRRADRAEARIASLEARLEALEAKLNG